MKLDGRRLAFDLQGEDVRLLHNELVQLSYAPPQEELQSAFFGAGTQAIVLEFQRQHGLEATGVVDRLTAARITTEVDRQIRSVNGRVVYVNGKPLTEVVVRAFDRDLRSEEPLGETVTNADGHYEIRYSAEQCSRAEKTSADLVVRAFDAQGDELAVSPILFNAGRLETVDLVVGGQVYRGPSEYEQLVDELTPLLQGISFADLTEDSVNQDVTFLSGETGQDIQRIVFLIVAHRLLRETGIAAEVFYGMFRQGLPTELSALLAQSPDVQRRALVRSTEENIIPPSFGAETDAIMAAFKAVLVRQVLKQDPKKNGDGRATLSDLLSIALPDAERRAKFLGAYVNHSGSVEGFWKELAADPEFGNHIGEIQRALQLGTLTGNHLPLVNVLHRMQKGGKISALSDVARFDAQGWLQIISQQGENGRVGAPPGMPGEDEAEREQNYAKVISHLVEDAFPTAFVAHRLREGDLAGREDLWRFFDTNVDFDVRSTRLQTYLDAHPDAFTDVEDKEGTATRIRALQRVYRLAPRYEQASALLQAGLDSAHAITRMGENVFVAMCADSLGSQAHAKTIYSRAQHVQAMAFTLAWNYGVSGSRTSMAVARDEPERDVEGVPEWSTLFGSLELCECEHCSSVFSPAAYLVDMLDFLRDRPSKLPGKKAQDILCSRRPDIGEIELTCENTNTPLPYVDLINETLEDAVAPFQPFLPFSLNSSFRADLNNRTVSPDLGKSFVPELSQQAVITVGGEGRSWDVKPDWWTIDDSAFTYTIRWENNDLRVVARSRQTKGSAAERAAAPQYVNAKAYTVLRGAVYPWTLPFDLWAEEARAYLGHLGVPRQQIMEGFQLGDRAAVLEGAALARECLGLTRTQADLITGAIDNQPGAANEGPWNLWGFENVNLSQQQSIPDPADSTKNIVSGKWLEILETRVDVFLQQSGLSYQELLELLDTYYVNPLIDTVRSIRIVSVDPDHPDTCETAKLRLAGLEFNAAMRTMQFVRLWRALGWSMRDLDRAITAFHPPWWGTFLTRLSHVQRLHTTLNVPVLRLLSWWADLDTAGYIDHAAAGQPRISSLYQRLFCDPATVSPSDPAFIDNPANLTGTLSDHPAALTAALGISTADLTLLLANQPDDVLSLASLSRLHRHTSLARALALSIRDYLTALKLITPDPFTTTTQTVIFVETVQRVRETGFSLPELDYLLRHTVTPGLLTAPRDETIATVLGELRAGLRKIADENTFRADPDDPAGPTTDLNGDLTATMLARLNWEPTLVDQAIATLAGSVTYEAPLAVLPGPLPNDRHSYVVKLAAWPHSFTIPPALRDVVAHDSDFQKLIVSRFLTQPERELLKEASDAAGDATLRNALAMLFREQDGLQGQISYDEQRRVLSFVGPMTNSRKERLDAVSGDINYRAAIQSLYAAPRRFIRRAMRAFAVRDFTAVLAALPAGAQIPPTLRSKVYFDAAADPRRLHCRGVMIEGERDMLLSLSTHTADPHHTAYRAAVTKLFDRPETLDPAATDEFLTVEGPGNDVAALFDTPVAPGDRFQQVLTKVLPHLRRVLSEQLVVQKMAEALHLETRTADLLLRTVLASPADPEQVVAEKRRCLAEFLDPAFADSNTNMEINRAAFAAQFTTFVLLHKAAMVADGFALTHRQLGWLAAYGPIAEWLDLNALPTDATPAAAVNLNGVISLAALTDLRDGLHQGEQALDQLLTLAHAVQPGAAAATKNKAKKAWIAALTHWTSWSQTEVVALLGASDDHTKKGLLNATFPDDYRSERLLVCLRRAFAMLTRLGISAQQAVGPATGNLTEAYARGMRQAVRAKYDEEQWLTVAKPLYDGLRDKQRAALLAYLVAHHTLPPTQPPARSVRDANDLYAHFLMDVEMTPCMMTSRIKQAISSVQLFVQRCFMQLEPYVAASVEVDVKWREWTWMKNYRIWEANRKVFLYPENWIEPELRDDKSPFFVELESEILQSELTAQAAEDAFLHYLEKLDQVAHLEVVGICHQLEKDTAGHNAVDILHVFARTPGTPPVYYYRQRVDSTSWTAWERVDLDIEGEHLVPTIWNRRLYLFWPIITEGTYPLNMTVKDGSMSNAVPRKYFDIKLAWSERKQRGWTTKRTAPRSLQLSQDSFGENPAAFFCRTLIDSRNSLNFVVLNNVLVNHMNTSKKVLSFRFDGCHGRPILTYITDGVDKILMMVDSTTGTVRDRMFYREDGEQPLYLPTPYYDARALAKTPGNFRLLPYPDGLRFTDHPFFYQDGSRTFFVIPGKILTVDSATVGLRTTDKVDPIVRGDAFEHHREKVVPISDPVGPIANPEDPLIYDPTFPVAPAVGMNVKGPGDPVPSPYIGGLPELGVGTLSGDMIDGADSVTQFIRARVSETVAGSRLVTTPTSDSHWASSVLSQLTSNFSITAPPKINYRFQAFYHPHVCAFVRELNRNGIDGLLQRRVQTHPQDSASRAPNNQPIPPLDFKTEYQPHMVSYPIVRKPYPVEGVDFDEDDAYALYNWELFFHVPLMIADRLSKNQRHEEAQKWFHYIFDPTDMSSVEVPKRYWRTKPFYEQSQEDYQRQRLSYLLKLLAKGPTSQDNENKEKEKEDLSRFKRAVADWRKDPFKPHLIARMRHPAYQKMVVMKYLDNVIAWADQLFRRDTIESINEATQLYILAAEILGHRPQNVPARSYPRVQTYNSVKSHLDDFSNTLVLIEEFISPSADGSAPQGSTPPSSPTPPRMLYFCLPKNDKLLGYWDTVADRLFKIRHCMNIEGVVRQLPLFEPPIDPALLVKAAAAGVDLGSVLNDLSAGPAHYRFAVLAQKATELCAELKSLGQAMLSALEKRDAERLSLLRAEQETAVLALAEGIRKLQKEEAKQNRAALVQSRVSAEARYKHYQVLLGVQNPQVPEIGTPFPSSELDTSASTYISMQGDGGLEIIQHEKEEMAKLQKGNSHLRSASSFEFFANFAHLIPNLKAAPFGVGVETGGQFVGFALGAFANLNRANATEASYQAGRAAKLAQYSWRAHEWMLQRSIAACEIVQIDQQIAAADLRIEIAEGELNNHVRQIAHAREVEAFLRAKYTNQELYGWMLGQLATVYFQTYQLTYDLAKRAERAFRHELGLKDSNFVQFGYWDSLKKGLLAGEGLFHDLKRMEIAYLDQNKREYEITKHISLAQLDPLALIQLRQTGTCIMRLPEALFDVDFPGHYLRRIKSVSVSIPCVTGPYTGVNCTLTLLKSSVRHANTTLGGKYARQEGDPRFTDSLGAVQSVATSSGQGDSGMFEPNLRDDRFLPFEGAGVIGEWQIQLPAAFRQFDYDTISDVVLHMRYTARESGGPLKQQATLELQTGLDEFLRADGQQGLAQIFSLRHDFSSEWHRFLNPPTGTTTDQTLIMQLTKEHFPFLFKNKKITITAMEVFVKIKPSYLDNYNDSTLNLSLDLATATQSPTLTITPWNGLLRAMGQSFGPLGDWKLTGWLADAGTRKHLNPEAIQDILIVGHYRCS